MKTRLIAIAAFMLLAGLGQGADAEETGDATYLPARPGWSDEGAPDANTDQTEQSFSYYSVLGSALRPRDSSNTFAYSGNGCIYVTGGSGIRLQFPVLVPRFSNIRYIRVYYYDTSASDLQVWLTQYDPGTSATDIGTVTSSGTSGFGSALSPDLNHVYDNVLNYTLNFDWAGVTNTTLQLCGVRIAYYEP